MVFDIDKADRGEGIIGLLDDLVLLFTEITSTGTPGARSRSMMMSFDPWFVGT